MVRNYSGPIDLLTPSCSSPKALNHASDVIAAVWKQCSQREFPGGRHLRVPPETVLNRAKLSATFDSAWRMSSDMVRDLCSNSSMLVHIRSVAHEGCRTDNNLVAFPADGGSRLLARVRARSPVFVRTALVEAPRCMSWASKFVSYFCFVSVVKAGWTLGTRTKLKTPRELA